VDSGGRDRRSAAGPGEFEESGQEIFPLDVRHEGAATQDFAAFAGRKVISVSGDGGFGQYLGDFTTAVKYNMNITHILLNNAELGKISKEQRAGEWPVWETDLHNPDFAAFAELCGAKGLKVTDAGQLDAAIAEALAHDGPALVEIVTDAELI
jgi:thiamine pyrophosphate-dependent acetolactate synthase large subunit-like protein